MEKALIDLPVELILIISQKLNNKDLISFKLSCQKINNIVTINTSIQDKATRLIVNKIKNYRKKYCKEERLCKILSYNLYRPHKQKGLNVYYSDNCDRNHMYKKFRMEVRYFANYKIIDIKTYAYNNCNPLGSLSFNPEVIDHFLMCQHLIDMIKRYDYEMCSVIIHRIKK